jgi:hypothetical protein
LIEWDYAATELGLSQRIFRKAAERKAGKEKIEAAPEQP